MRRHSRKLPVALGRRRGGRTSFIIMALALCAVILMAAQQGSFVTSLRGQKRKHRAAVDTAQLGNEPFGKSLEAVMAKLNKRKPSKDDKARGGGICSVVPSDPATGKLWTRFVADVLAASKHADDPKYSHLSWTKSLLVELSPSGMARSVVSLPPPAAVDRMLKIVRKRLYDPDANPPLRIAVLGGAVTEGQGCDVASVAVPEGSIMANPTFCAWPYRFEQLVNSMLGVGGGDGSKKVIEVTNLAEDGTDTAFMTPLLRNRMYPPSVLPHGPDVVINAYTTHDYTSYGDDNDVLVNTMREEMNAFIPAVETSNQCGDPPLIVHMDDSDGAAETIGRDRVLALRYIAPVSRVAKADKATKNVPKDLPFGMAGHLAMSWTLAFGIVDAVLRHCSSTEAQPSNKNDDAAADSNKCAEGSRCTFAWFAGPMGTVTRPSQIQQYILPHVVDNTGWEASSDMSTGFNRKSGLVAMEPQAKITFQFKDISKEIRYLNLMTLKSNGEEWIDGRARFALLAKENKEGKDWQETSFEIEGGHKSPTHITYHFEVDLKENSAKVGSDVVLQIELVAGSSFKILGIMLCS